MNRIEFYTKNIAFAALLGCFIGMAFVAILASGWQENAVRYGTYGITVLVGLFASAIAVGSALLNINSQQSLIERKHTSARAVLPITLSKLYQLAECGFETALNAESLRIGPKEEAVAAFQNLQIPSDDIEKIRRCIEAADQETQAWLSLILAHWQIETSRLEGELFDMARTTLPRQLANYAVDWLVIRAMIINLFDYSRTGKKPETAISPEHIAVPILSRRLTNEDVAEARNRTLKYFERNGGLTFESFKKRLLDS